ncbi:5'-deoxyadenosine deaminase [Streptomyces afghaniensis]
MRDGAQLARRLGVRLHTHGSETVEEEKFCHELFGMGPTDYFESTGWLGEDVWMAHCVHMNDSDIAAFARTRTGVAHCPSSNARLAAGIARVPDMLAAGVPVGLGVDGTASNESGELHTELRNALLINRLGAHKEAALNARQALRLGTYGGAQVLGRAAETGSLQPGELADLVLWRAGHARPRLHRRPGDRPGLRRGGPGHRLLRGRPADRRGRAAAHGRRGRHRPRHAGRGPAAGEDRRAGLTTRMTPAGRDGSRPVAADPSGVHGGRLRGARARVRPGTAIARPPHVRSRTTTRTTSLTPTAVIRRSRVTDRREAAVADHPVDEKLPALKMATTGLQHVAAMYAGVVAPPLIVGAAIGLTATDLTFLTGACLFTAGLATFLQTIGIWKIGARLPFVNGVTFAGVAPMTAIVASTEDKSDALPVIFGAVIVAGLLGFLAAPVFCKAVRFFHRW